MLMKESVQIKLKIMENVGRQQMDIIGVPLMQKLRLIILQSCLHLFIVITVEDVGTLKETLITLMSWAP